MMAKKSISSAEALKANTAALKAHTRELRRHTAALMAHTVALTPATVKRFVYGVLGAPLTLPDTTKLAALGYDVGALSGLAAEINDQHWQGVQVQVAAIQRCTAIANVIAVVAAARG
jgi:hypothetical protein